jgi:hypothetical protein
VNSIVLNDKASQLELKYVSIASAYVLWSLTSFGWIFDHKSWAIQRECLRDLAVCGVLAWAQKNGSLGTAATYLIVFHAVSAVWLFATQRNYTRVKGKKE